MRVLPVDLVRQTLLADRRPLHFRPLRWWVALLVVWGIMGVGGPNRVCWAQPRRLSPLVGVPGEVVSGWRLTNYSAGAKASSPIDPQYPTVVITHGFNILPDRMTLTTPHAYAMKIRQLAGREVNVLGFQWNSSGQGSYDENTWNSVRAGQTLGAELIRRGVVPDDTVLIGHSMGSVVIASACQFMYSQTGGKRTRKLLMIDAPKRRLPVIVNELGAPRCAKYVENCWAGRISGFGAPIDHPSVWNIQAPYRRRVPLNAHPLNPGRNNHVDIIIWYYTNRLHKALQ